MDRTLPQPPARNHPSHNPHAQVSVVVIGYNDAAHITGAVRSALAQGPVVGEVIAVDDCSTDDSPRLLAALAEHDPRVRVIRRTANSGGCGTPRNDGIDAAAYPYVMFLDSDDVLPPGAAGALLTAASTQDAEVSAGLCVRRELPSGREVPWQPELYAAARLVPRPELRARLVHDTLCVDKLYRTDFLRKHDVRFPDGHVIYEDFVFAARVLAAAPRIALIPDTVYVWHVRRAATRLSISLDRSGIANWQARMAAHRHSVEILRNAPGGERLARAARAKFIDHELRMYVRELPTRSTGYQREWWSLTRTYLATFDAADLDAAPAPGRVIARVILASREPRDLPRLKEVAARPARLTPPYPRAADATPVWADDLPQVTLEHLLVRPVRLLPLAVDGELRPRGGSARLTLRLRELYGRVAEAGPTTVDVELLHRQSGHPGQRRTAAFGAARPDGTWTSTVLLDLGALASQEGGVWDVRLRLHFADGTTRETTARAAAGPGLLRRTVAPDARRGVLLVQPYATQAGNLSLRLAPGVRGVAGVARRRLGRLVRALTGASGAAGR
ncbi:transferase [Streptomyces alfalfae]|uniref:Transferase n=1 Tax=Streptomyces alfalfae TaxID=1642299 RepID=A0ABM6GVQ6_9ACTN|nr:glycosyltransferase [Streptomyces alfalfae]AYA18398.1 glycosyltransferase [Streptomyces fradiae]APY88018.1 transferase [Streptomyces alfalfae]QUI32017.1 glycosyltransferase [Streptomyces alfalfae]RXX46195.1 transferase [Streptomyces alfalfae]RZN07279.1 glycosyltransferase [Streptomyces alfalfae]